MTESVSLPLWQQMQATAQVLQAVRQGHSMNDALAQVRDVPRPGVQALAFDALRCWGLAQALRVQLASRAPGARADALLCLALALLAPESGAAYANHTVVNQATEAAKRSPAMCRQAGFINACLRRFLRERASMLAAAQESLQARWNHPDWWIERLRRDHPDDWEAIARQDLAHAAMTLRVNARRTSVAQYQKRLAEVGMPSWQVGPDALALQTPVPVQALPHFDQGWVAVQDAAAQMAAPLLLDGLTATPGQPLRVLDACAAPGGKTAHLLERADAEVLALEIDAVRARRIDENLARLGLAAEVRIADAANVEQWWDGRLFDGILLDAPCSASGIVRRHPDILWLRRPSDLASLAATQQRLLDRLWPLVRPGGRLLFCTCSVFKVEGDDQIAAFLARNSDAIRLSAPGHLFPQGDRGACDMPDNAPREHDGFYYARLEKNGG